MSKVTDTLEDIQEATVMTGGSFIRRQVLRDMTVGELLDNLTPNGVRFKIYADVKNEGYKPIPDIYR